MGFPLLLFAWTITEIIRLVEHLQQQSNATRVRNLLGFSRCLILLTLFLFCRYSMYAINLFSSPPFPLTWLRCLLRSLYPSAHFICHHQCHKHGSKNKILCQSPPCSYLTKSRYTFFIVAYPAGVTGELLCSYSAMLYSKTLDHKKNTL